MIELTQQEIEWVKDKFAQENAINAAIARNQKIDRERAKIAKKYEKQLKKLADEGKIVERKALIGVMVQEADEAERQII